MCERGAPHPHCCALGARAWRPFQKQIRGANSPLVIFSKRAPRSEKGVAPNASQAIMRTLLTTQTPLAVRHFWVSRAAFIRGIKSRLDHASGRRSSAYFNRLCPTAEEAWVPSLVHSHMDHVLLVCARIIKFYPTSPHPHSSAICLGVSGSDPAYFAHDSNPPSRAAFLGVSSSDHSGN